MYKRGAVIMRNISLRKQSSFSFSQVFYNNQLTDYIDYQKVLRVKLLVFDRMMKEVYSSILDFLRDYLNENNDNHIGESDLNLIEQFIDDYNLFIKKGTPILDELLAEVSDKKIDNDTFQLLIKILHHQEDITKDIVERDITLDRLEIILNHLRDLPYYLQTDLELDTLPTITSPTTNVSYKPQLHRQTFIEKNYNPFDKETA